MKLFLFIFCYSFFYISRENIAEFTIVMNLSTCTLNSTLNISRINFNSCSWYDKIFIIFYSFINVLI